MPDFSTLLRRPAGIAKRQPPLPAYDYPGIITNWEPGESAQKKTPYIRFHCKASGWPESLPEAARQDSDGNELDLSKKSFRYDFYLTDDALVMLDEFIRSCGVDLPDDGSASYEETIPRCIGAPVTMSVQQDFNEKSNETYNPPWLKSLRGEANR